MRGTVKIRNSSPWIVIAILLAGAAARAQDATPAAASQTSDHVTSTSQTIPVTTQSLTAQRATKWEWCSAKTGCFVDEGLAFFREAVKADPQFALGHATLGYFTNDPKEEKQESALAEKFISNASPDEQLLIRWMNGTKNGDLVAGNFRDE